MRNTCHIKSPYISDELEEKYPHHAVISLDGEILGIGKNALLAFEEAKKSDARY